MNQLSIIIPTLNEAEGVVELLKELQWIRAAGHELIVVDGGSKDGTSDLASAWVDHLAISTPGRAIQLNLGAKVARHDILLFLHADTRISQEAIEASLNHCYREQAWGRFDVRLSGRQRRFRVVERAMNMRSRLTGIATGDQAMFIRRELFEQIGGFPEIPIMEDIALSKRLNEISKPVCLWQQVETSSRRWEEAGTIKTIALMWFLRLAFMLGAEPGRLAARYEDIR
ncbi:MAG TPA: glycosyl transferase [Gammaproteobacteria bacterium]|nr:glycosyl transferase [Gammaproteobacteria bacterium]